MLQNVPKCDVLPNLIVHQVDLSPPLQLRLEDTKSF